MLCLKKQQIAMFTNYYKLMNISPTATEEEINATLEQSTLSSALVEEMKMVLQNKSLKALYDEEVKQYEVSQSKQNYEISNTTLDREIKKVRAYISNKARESVTVEEGPKKSNVWLWIIVFIVISCLGKCISSYNRGKTLEENRQKYLRGEYDNISINRPTFDITRSFKPILIHGYIINTFSFTKKY